MISLAIRVSKSVDLPAVRWRGGTTRRTKEEPTGPAATCDKALDLFKQNRPDVFIRIGNRHLETGLSGIERTYQNSLRPSMQVRNSKGTACSDFMGMEI